MGGGKLEVSKTQDGNGSTNPFTSAVAPMGALKLKAAAGYLGGLSVATMHRLIKRKLLNPNRATRHLLFTVNELDRFLRDGQLIEKHDKVFQNRRSS